LVSLVKTSQSLRPANHHDYDFLHHVHKATLKKYITQIWGWDENWQRDHFRDHFDPAKRQIIVLNGNDIGAIGIEKREGDIFLAYIAILPDYQGQGIGTTLIRQLLSEAFEAGSAVVIHVLKGNPAKHLYERLGFTVVKETDIRYVLKAMSEN